MIPDQPSDSNVYIYIYNMLQVFELQKELSWNMTCSSFLRSSWPQKIQEYFYVGEEHFILFLVKHNSVQLIHTPNMGWRIWEAITFLVVGMSLGIQSPQSRYSLTAVELGRYLKSTFLKVSMKLILDHDCYTIRCI